MAPTHSHGSVYDVVKLAILNGDLPQGEKLIETVLAERFSVSRTPIREALGRLEQDGLAVRDAHGLIVRQWGPEEVLDIYEVRRALEAMAGRTAAKRRSDHDLHVLSRIVTVSEEISSSDFASMRSNNQQFHRAIWTATHNNALLETLGRLYQYQHLGRESAATTFSYQDSWKDAKDQHRALTEAIERRDADAAEAIASEHIHRARAIRAKLVYETSPEA